ncbi:Uncharacterised protein [Shigella flexneri]|nr:Uncharacterised protein [Shigella flexneri]
MVFDHFIFDDTHAGFGNGHFREWDSSICSSQSGGAEDFVYLLLSETGIFTLGFFYTLYECVKFSDISNSLTDENQKLIRAHTHCDLLKEFKH